MAAHGGAEPVGSAAGNLSKAKDPIACVIIEAGALTKSCWLHGAPGTPDTASAP